MAVKNSKTTAPTRGETRKTNRALLQRMAETLDADVGMDLNPPDPERPYFYTVGDSDTSYFASETALREALKVLVIERM